MPLKHATETLLVSLLGVAILLAAFATAFLPPPGASMTPWGVAIVIAVLYPVLLHPLMKRRRADIAFRLLHLVPALMLLARFAIDLLTPAAAPLERVGRLYLWGWTMPAVLLAYLLLIAFCVRVLRQRRLRMMLLLAFFVPFAVLAVGAEQRNWNPRIAAALRQPGRLGVITRWIAQLPEAVSQEAEEQWQMQQRRMERRTERLAQGNVSSLSVEGARNEQQKPLVSSAAPPSSKKFDAIPPILQKKKQPTPLPPSGFGSEVALPMVLAGYTGVLHLRARRRAKA